jgi:hypothetical protein
MKKLMTLLAAVAALSVLVVAQELKPEDEAIRSRIEAHYDVVPLADGVALRPKRPTKEVRLIEVSDTIAINGATVSGRELRERIGEDADAILKLSYLEPTVRRSLFAKPQEPQPSVTQPPAVEPGAGERAAEPPDRRHRSIQRSGGDRVRIFGDVTVREGEEVSGQAVAVIGSVRVDGDVGDQVVAVLGSVDLGPKAIVRGDIVSVGGRVRRAQGSQVGGAITEVSLADARWDPRFEPWLREVGLISMFDGFSGVPRLIGTMFRLLLLMLFASMAMVVARGSVERSAQRVSDNPIRATLVGLLAEVMFLPILVLTCIVLAISIVGIPLLLLVPFVILFLILLGLVGFTGTALALGQWARRQFSLGTGSGFADVWLGIVIILFPVLVGRLIGLGGFLTGPVVVLLVGAGIGLEFLAWSSGFGAVLTNTFSRWQARRATRNGAPPAQA